LAGLAGNKFLTKNLFRQLFKMKTLKLLHQKIYFSSLRRFYWIPPGQSTTSCLQLFGIFTMMQRSCFKQIIAS